MLKRLLLHELKSISRDKMYLFLSIYPIIMAIIAYFLIPYLAEQSSAMASNIVVLVFILLNGFMFGAITGFTLLDDQDDKVLLSLKITPISVRYYVLLKLLISYILGVFATFILIMFSGFYQSVDILDLIFIIVLAPLQGPIFSLLINALANNKVEGFVIMKLSGIILLIPIASLFLIEWTELFLGFIPGFWTSRIISMQLIPQDYFLNSSTLYFIIGVIVHIIVGTLLFKLYTKKHNL
jgi:fluoroquinolone transport system permease protein